MIHFVRLTICIFFIIQAQGSFHRFWKRDRPRLLFFVLFVAFSVAFGLMAPDPSQW